MTSSGCRKVVVWLLLLAGDSLVSSPSYVRVAAQTVTNAVTVSTSSAAATTTGKPSELQIEEEKLRENVREARADSERMAKAQQILDQLREEAEEAASAAEEEAQEVESGVKDTEDKDEKNLAAEASAEAKAAAAAVVTAEKDDSEANVANGGRGKVDGSRRQPRISMFAPIAPWLAVAAAMVFGPLAIFLAVGLVVGILELILQGGVALKRLCVPRAGQGYAQGTQMIPARSPRDTLSDFQQKHNDVGYVNLGALRDARSESFREQSGPPRRGPGSHAGSVASSAARASRTLVARDDTYYDGASEGRPRGGSSSGRYGSEDAQRSRMRRSSREREPQGFESRRGQARSNSRSRSEMEAAVSKQHLEP
eukprot:TRINITY_DN24306_c0_g1_i1.p1 TRINITY_DN24306_c0_g1~~TRINITY_DN24306_c0_g1_i1.p1  ORF type:complete len:368 (+),score=68.44 TRINITY_DN24306_c0_g1_i1:99-1202(+)